jgi:hypothetical protein
MRSGRLSEHHRDEPIQSRGLLPSDFASFVRYYSDLKKYMPTDVPTTEPLSIDELDMLTTELAPSSRVRWHRTRRDI